MEEIKNKNADQEVDSKATAGTPEVDATDKKTSKPKQKDKPEAKDTKSKASAGKDGQDGQDAKDAKDAKDTKDAKDSGAAELASLTEELDSIRDQNLRLQAEIQNMHKRFSQELAKARSSGLLDISSLILETLDNLEKSLSFYDTDEGKDQKPDSEESVQQGLELTYKTLIDGLGNFGIKEINPQGELFDPEYHEVLAQVKMEDKPKGTVIAVVQKGYMMDNRLLRAAKVQVVE